MGAEVIVDKIKQKVSEEITSIRNDGIKRAEELRAGILSLTAEEEKKIEKQSAEEAEQIERRILLLAQLQVRKNTLATKRLVLDESFLGAKQELLKLSDKRWADLISKLIIDNVQLGDDVLRVPKSDRAKYDRNDLNVSQTNYQGTFIAQLSAAVSERMNRTVKLELDKINANFDGGVMIISKNSDIDASFDRILADIKEEYEREVAAILFEARGK